MKLELCGNEIGAVNNVASTLKIIILNHFLNVIKSITIGLRHNGKIFGALLGRVYLSSPLLLEAIF